MVKSELETVNLVVTKQLKNVTLKVCNIRHTSDTHIFVLKTIMHFRSNFSSKNLKKKCYWSGSNSRPFRWIGPYVLFYILHVTNVTGNYVTWNLTFILECPEEKVAETGCLASDSYVFKTCKNRQRKPAKKINGYYPHGTSCGNVMCSKQFFGFTWKTKTTKIVCECDNGRCGWSKPLHQCPTGLNFGPRFFIGYR